MGNRASTFPESWKATASAEVAAKVTAARPEVAKVSSPSSKLSAQPSATETVMRNSDPTRKVYEDVAMEPIVRTTRPYSAIQRETLPIEERAVLPSCTLQETYQSSAKKRKDPPSELFRQKQTALPRSHARRDASSLVPCFYAIRESSKLEQPAIFGSLDDCEGYLDGKHMRCATLTGAVQFAFGNPPPLQTLPIHAAPLIWPPIPAPTTLDRNYLPSSALQTNLGLRATATSELTRKYEGVQIDPILKKNRTWLAKFECLQEYKRKYGHVHVTAFSCKDDPVFQGLYHWLDQHFRKYAACCRMEEDMQPMWTARFKWLIHLGVDLEERAGLINSRKSRRKTKRQRQDGRLKRGS